MTSLLDLLRAPKELASHLNEAAKRSAEYSERHFRFLGVLATVIPAAYLVDLWVGKPFYDTLVIRTIAFLLAVPLVFHDARRFRDWAHFHLYFVGVVTFAMPFSFGLMLVLNAASAPPGQQIEMLWILQYFISLFLFIQLIHNGLLATVLWCLSSFLVMASLVLLEQPNWQELNRVVVYPVTGYLTALIFGIVTNRNVDYVNSEKLRAAAAIGGNIAHELRTPLASIRSLAHAVRNHSETLTTTYSRAKELDLHVGELTPLQIEGLGAALRSIEEEVAYSNTIIDMLLLNTAEKSSYATAGGTFAVASAVSEAVARFPFNNSRERRLVTVCVEHDFFTDASRLLVIHVIFNLLKNGVYYAQKSADARLTVTVRLCGSKGVLEFSDNGPGISHAQRKRIFDRFYTTSDAGQGAGIGLSFCKMVMESIGGEIQCESREGEYTTFRLLFPPPASPPPNSALAGQRQS